MRRTASRFVHTAPPRPSPSDSMRLLTPNFGSPMRPFAPASGVKRAPLDHHAKPSFVSSAPRPHRFQPQARQLDWMPTDLVESVLPEPPATIIRRPLDDKESPREEEMQRVDDHPFFGKRAAAVPSAAKPATQLLATKHSAFGDIEASRPDASKFSGCVSVGGLFFAVDPNLCVLGSDEMNPNARLTIRDTCGRQARVRYSCRLRGHGFKVEALMRCQVGWITPKVSFTEFPYRIQLGTGFDLSVPFICHFTAIQVLDEQGRSTGSCLFFSGTPMIGLSCGFVRLTGGEMVQAPGFPVDPDREAAHFVGNVHYRQLGFFVFKIAGYLVCGMSLCCNLGEICTDAKSSALLWVTKRLPPSLATA